MLLNSSMLLCIALKKNGVFKPHFYLHPFLDSVATFCYIVWTMYAVSVQATKMEAPSSHYKLGEAQKVKFNLISSNGSAVRTSPPICFPEPFLHESVS